MKEGYVCPYCGSMIDEDKFVCHKNYCFYRPKKI